MSWGHRWLTRKAEVRESPLQGIGTFAKAYIAKGEIILVNGGVVVPSEDREEYVSTVGPYGAQISDGFWVCPASRDEVIEAGAINHSCDPNVGVFGSVAMITMKNICLGEELVTDYAFYESSFKPFGCNCGSKKCRKVIAPDDWENKELQSKYGEYFSPYLRTKFCPVTGETGEI